MENKTVIGVFSSQQVAEEAVSDLRRTGFDREISILAKDAGQKGQGKTGNTSMGVNSGELNTGITTGGVIGGLAGLAVGAGALAIPGIGPLIAAGPIAGLLSGAATGGIAGGLVDWGIPETEGREYEEDVRKGNILVSVRCDAAKADDASKILTKHGSNKVRIH